MPNLAVQWLRDGAEIAGAAENHFTPGAAEDGTAVAARVTARNVAGELAAETAAIAITRTPPAAIGDPADVVLAQGAAAPVVPAATAFGGDALRFAAAGGGASIDPATGALTLPTDARRAGETVTVTATNSGGAATVEFAVTVLAAPAASGGLEAAVFAVGSVATVAAGAAFTGDALVFALDAGPEGVAVDPATGLVTIPTGAALEGAVTVRATNAVGAATAAFALRVLAPPRLTGALADVAATVGETRTVDVGALVTPKTGLTWTTSRAGWAVERRRRDDPHRRAAGRHSDLGHRVGRLRAIGHRDLPRQRRRAADDADHGADARRRGRAGDGARQRLEHRRRVFAGGAAPSSPSGASCATARRSRPSARRPPTPSWRPTRARPSPRKSGAPTARSRRRC